MVNSDDDDPVGVAALVAGLVASLVSRLLFGNPGQVLLGFAVILGGRGFESELFEDIVRDALDQVEGQVHGVPHVLLPGLVHLFAVLELEQLSLRLPGLLVHPDNLLSNDGPGKIMRSLNLRNLKSH